MLMRPKKVEIADYRCLFSYLIFYNVQKICLMPPPHHTLNKKYGLESNRHHTKSKIPKSVTEKMPGNYLIQMRRAQNINFRNFAV